MPNTNSKEQKKARIALFIDSAYELIEECGFSDVSIRKIADRAGYHNSSLYFYFSDFDHLMSLASVRYFEEYSSELVKIGSLYTSDSDVFFPIWECFCRCAFDKPEIYYHFFFGKYCEHIHAILNMYYDVFPEEKQEYSDVIREMYYANTFSERCLAILAPLIDDPRYRLKRDRLELLNDISIAFFKSLLEKKCEDLSCDNKQLTEEFINGLHLLLDA